MPPSAYDPRTLLDIQPVIVTVVDPSTHRIEFQNETGFKQFGETSGRSCYETIANCSAPCAFCKMPEALARGEMTSNEVALSNEQVLLVQWAPARTADGRTHVIETITDVTERKRLEAHAHRAEKMEALARLAGGVAHDLNNLLTVIQGYTELLLADLAETDPQWQRIGAIRVAGERASRLGRQLLNFTRHTPAPSDTVDVNEFLKEATAAVPTMAQRAITVQYVLDPAAGTVSVNRLQLKGLLTILITNACEAMSDGGTLTLGTRWAVKGHDAGLAAKPGDYVHLSVTDTGPGLTPDIRAHLFEPFFTTKPGRTGLGLATVYGVVQQLGGYVEAWSQPGQGARFSIALPQSPLNPAEEAAGPGAGRSMPRTQPRILVCEDDVDVRLLVADVLRGCGYAVEEASDGLQGLHIMRQTPIDLLLSDVLMPRLTGTQLAQQVRHLYPDTKILLMSGYLSDTVTGLDEGAALLQKPFTPKDVIATVGALLPLSG